MIRAYVHDITFLQSNLNWSFTAFYASQSRPTFVLCEVSIMGKVPHPSDWYANGIAQKPKEIKQLKALSSYVMVSV